MRKPTDLSAKERDGLLRTLKARFEANMNRHPDLEWTTVQARLESSNSKLWSLNEMEAARGSRCALRI
jgi:hypothetical protein